MSERRSIAFLVQRIGPYHDARLRALAEAGEGPVCAVEFRPEDPVYRWAPVEAASGYERRQTRSAAELRAQLDALDPASVVCVGYADPEVQTAAAWALRRRVPLVTCSDSTWDDEPRSRVREALKRRLVDAFDAALVAGARSASYMESLGMPRDRLFRPWDVVDNAHFEARRTGGAGWGGPGLASPYFLCVARFVPKKNLLGLIDAYRSYAVASAGGAWPLVLSGSGPLEAALRERVREAALGDHVHFPGFLQYDELPGCYAGAGAFVLPSVSDQWGLVVNEAMAAGLPVIVSRRCGCAEDLVVDGENGFTFDPGSPATLSELLARMASMAPGNRRAMGERSRERVRVYSPKAFAEGLRRAIERSRLNPRGASSWVTRWALRLTAARRGPGSAPGRGVVYCCFLDPKGFSGQRAATEIVIRGLSSRGWTCRLLPQPVLDRDASARAPRARYLLGVAGAWTRSLRMLGGPDAWLYVNLGLTRVAFARDALTVALGRMRFGRRRVVISLHGSLFMQWTSGSVDARMLRALLRMAGTVTVLGERQRARLIELGLPAESVRVVVNTCTLDPVPARAKVASARHEARAAVRLLHLSSLIDTKGYPDYLEALVALANQEGPPIEAVLCGRVVPSDYAGRFPSAAAAEAWIEARLEEINRGGRVRARWVRGAAGTDKETLFREADIFVLPTRYAVEAQPIVLLEAMASACAIVTTRVGEIPTILDESSAAFLSDGGPRELAEALQRLAVDPEARHALARSAHARFEERYGVARHIDAWEALLEAGTRPR